LLDGTHTITANSTDAAGNIAIPASISVLIDTTKPQIVEILPSSGQNQGYEGKDILINSSFSIRFNESVSIANDAFFFVTQANQSQNIPHTVSYDDSTYTATVTPTSNLEYETTYFLSSIYPTRILDPVGNTLEDNNLWNTYKFTTGVIPDTTAPIITFTGPSYSLNDHITVNASTDDNSAITITCSDSGAIITNNNDGTFTISNLVDGTHTVTANSTDEAGNAATPASISVLIDTVVLDIVSISPGKNAIDTIINSSVVITFNKSLDPSTVNDYNALQETQSDEYSLEIQEAKGIKFYDKAKFDSSSSIVNRVPYTIVYDDSNKSITLTPKNDLNYSTEFMIWIENNILSDVHGNKLSDSDSAFFDYWLFTTEAAPDTTAPIEISKTPPMVI